jgi:putative phosphoribosyl transferase
MYFASRVQAGRMLASRLAGKYEDKKNVVLALDDGGVVVGLQISQQLGCPIMLLSSSEILLPREPNAIAGITDNGTFTYNHSYSDGEIDELAGEYFNLIEQEKLTEMHILNHLQKGGKTTNIAQIKKANIILVSEGLKTGFKMDLAVQFLKPIEIGKMVVAVPFASVQAVDRMHVMADDLYCLNVVAEYIDTDHYYDQKDVPPHDIVAGAVQQLLKASSGQTV